MRTCSLLSLLALVAAPTAARATAPPCVDIATTGAIANDGADDRATIQTAIDLALAVGGPHAICLRAGVYDVSPGPTGNASFNLGNVGGVAATDFTVLGAGSASVLRMNGNAAGQTWVLFLLTGGASRVHFHDLALDGSLATHTPAGRLIQIGTGDATPVSEISLDGVSLRAARNEAIQIAGGATPTTHAIAIRASAFQANLGAAIDIRGGVDQVRITTTTFVGNTGEDVRTRGTPIDNLSLTDSTSLRDPAATAIAISLQGGTPTAPNTRAIVAHNLLVNGSLDVMHFDAVTVAGNFVLGSPQAGARPELDVIGRAASTVIDANTLVRTSTTPAGVIATDVNTGVGPTRTTIRGNLIVQAAGSTIAQLTGVSDLTCTANQLVFGNASTATFSAIQLRAINAPADRLVVTDNVIAGGAGGGSLDAAIRLSNSASLKIGHAIVAGNVARGVARGVAFDNSFDGPVIVADNLFDASAIDLSGGFVAQVVGGNRGEPIQLVGTGDPTAANIVAPTGSIYLRRDSSTHTLYVRQAASWMPK